MRRIGGTRRCAYLFGFTYGRTGHHRGDGDYGYSGLPQSMDTETTLTLNNTNETEVHELVAILLPEDEDRSVVELVEDPEALAPYFPSVETVVIAPPGEGGSTVEGTGVLSQPGRYAIICAIPTGADPVEYLEAAAEAEGGPPDVASGPPHFVHGMHAEITVTG